MTKIKYELWNPTSKSKMLISCTNSILSDFMAQDLTPTLRQLYYQLVKDNVIENTDRSYKNLGTLVTKGRKAGLISWYAIEDRNRQFNNFWSDEDDVALIKKLPNYIRFDQWARQENYVEVWVEKDALVNVVQKACDPFLVPYIACKGYMSSSEIWRAGRRLRRAAESGKNVTIIHLGDHDPSGIDMTRDNASRLQMYSEMEDVNVNRIALNMNQIEHYAPPPNPTKLSDSRAKPYIKEFGKHSWELDALTPSVLIELITDSITPLIDFELWEEVQEQEDDTRERLRMLGDNWEQVSDFLQGIG